MLSEKDYYEMQKPNLLYPNEEYINSEKNINKADLSRFTYVYNDILQNVTGGIMLDVGCNDGYFMRHFNWPFTQYIGVDMFSINEYLKSEDVSNFTKGGKIEYRTGLVEKMKFKEKFDFIFAGEIIEHVVDVKEFLLVLEKILKDGGYICFTTPNNIGISQPEHNRQYDLEALSSELSPFFEIVKIDVLPAINDSWPFLYAKCRKHR